MTVEASWNGCIIARSDDTIVVEGNHYFPDDSVDQALLENSDTTSSCPWKGTAHYYNINAGNQVNADAAWYYPQPLEKASHIAGHVAFWKGVEISQV
ncbi:DUF427 domain-containing protein [Altererythrobacter aquiaggeris]|uniref:DUF427 domain-containing protein n=1 Tax=Aestuarierythrobacter aquiaggeris TaxID=1898396 RepID=UPI00301B15CD